MKSKLLSNIGGRREWALIFDAGDEVADGLKRFAEAEKLQAAHFTGIGAFANLTVAWFDIPKQAYQPIEIDEQVEVLSLIGDVAESKGKPSVHAHLCVAKRDGTAHGGHLQRALVRPTLEVIVIESPAHLRKSFRPEFGLALIDLDQSTPSGSLAAVHSERKG
jgi:predicted DNA-binding protein with PD1-like motif